jgi:hypothetical protein
LDHSITQPRANPAEEPVNKGEFVDSLGLSNPAELKGNFTAPLVAIQPVVGFGLLLFFSN